MAEGREHRKEVEHIDRNSQFQVDMPKFPNTINVFSESVQEMLLNMKPTFDALSATAAKLTANFQTPPIYLPEHVVQNIRRMSDALSEMSIVQNQIFTLLDFPAVQPEITEKQLKQRVENMSEKDRNKLKKTLQSAAKKAICTCKKDAPKIAKAVLLEMSIDTIVGLIKFLITLFKK